MFDLIFQIKIFYKIMSNKVLILALLTVLTISLRITRHTADEKGVPGGWSSIDVTKLTQQQSDVDKFIRESDKSLKTANLTKGEQQIVAGTNYRFTYDIKENGKDNLRNITVFVDLKGNKEIKNEN